MKEVRFMIPDELYKQYKIICVENELSPPRQFAEIVRKFVEIQQDNKERTKHLRKN